MAHIEPAGWRELAVTGAALREIETLSQLAAGLSDSYTVLHGVHWTNSEHGYSAYGEIDFIIIAADGRVLLIEQKSGLLQETADGLVRTYDGKERQVRSHILQTIAALSARFRQHGETLSIDYLLYCPDYRVKDPARAGMEPSHLIDAAIRHRLIPTIRTLLPEADATPQRNKVKKFFSDTLQLAPDPSAMIGSATRMVTRLAGGLATWARQLEFEPYRLHVNGTAGSGKTQLALTEYRAALDAGKSPLYVCYNRPLADHIRTLVPEGGRVFNFHGLADTFARSQGGAPDYQEQGVWTNLERMLAEAPLPDAWQFDVLIVDEGQDFSPAWRDIVLRLLRPEGRAIWLEDPMQNLYGRAPLALPGWVTLHARANYRSPREIVALLKQLGTSGMAIDAASPFLGAEVELFTYPHDNADAMLDKTKQAVTRCLAAGFARTDIALLSYRGRDNSTLLHLDRLGQHALRSFTGDYDLFGAPVFRSGELLAESVYRFKGQSAPAVILTEIDFDTLDERTFRKLFVGMTRARLKLILVLSERAAALFYARTGWPTTR